MVRRVDRRITRGKGFGFDSQWWLACCLACLLSCFLPLLEPIVWSQFFEFLMVFLNVPRVLSSVLEAFKVVLDGSRYVCGGSKAVLVSKVPLLF